MHKSFLKKVQANWGYIVMGIVLLAITVASIRPGFTLLGNDNFSPELDPSLSLERILESPGYREYRVNGVPSDSEQSDLARNTLYLALDFAPDWVISQGYILIALVIGVWFTGLVAQYLLARLKPKLNQSSLQLTFLISGISYLFNLKMLSIFYFPLLLFIAAYAFFPPLLYFSLKFIERKNWSNAFWILFFWLMVSTAAFTITNMLVLVPTYFILIIAAVWTYREDNSTSIGTLGMLFGFFAITTAFYFVPFSYYTINNADDIQESFINRQITPTSIENEADYNTLENVPIYKTNWFDLRFDGIDYTFEYRSIYAGTFATILLYIPFALAILGVVYALFKRNLVLGTISLLFILGTVLSLGNNSPVGFLYESFQTYIPYFRQVFRLQSTKFWIITLLPLAILAGVGAYVVNIFFTFGEGKKLSISIVAAIVVSTPLIALGLPIFQNGLFYERTYNEIPEEYFSLAEYLVENDPHGKIYVAPEANTLYFRNHDWSGGEEPFEVDKGPGFFGSGFLHYMLPNPLIERNLSVGSQYAENAQFGITTAYNSGDTDVFTGALQLYDAQYVLLDASNADTLPGYVIDSDLIEAQTANNTELELIWEEGFLQLYEVPELSDDFESFYEDHNNQNLGNTLLNSPNVNYFASSLGDIHPLALDFDTFKKDGDTLRISTEYTGADTSFSIEPPDSLDEFFTKVTVENGELFIEPTTFELEVGGTSLFENRRIEVGSIEDTTTHIVIGGIAYPIQNIEQLHVPVSFENMLQSEITFLEADALLEFQPRTFIVRNIDESLSFDFVAESDMAFDIELQTEVEGKMQATVCVQASSSGEECINNGRTALLTQDSSSLTIESDTFVQKGESITVFVALKNLTESSSRIRLTDIAVDQFVVQTSEFVDSQYALNRDTIEGEVNNGDTIAVTIPLYSKENSFDFFSAEDLLPEFNLETCIDSEDAAADLQRDGGSISTENTLCTVTFFPSLETADDSDILYMAYLDAENTGGIPIDVWLREDMGASDPMHFLYQQRAAYLDAGQRLDFFYMPADEKTYELFIQSYAGRTNASENALNDFVLMPVPESWLDMVLKVDVADSIEPIALEKVFGGYYSGTASQGDVITIPNAEAPGWMVLNLDSFSFSSGDSVLLNGWQQGFRVSEDGTYMVFFWPNVVSQVLMVCLGSFLLWFLGAWVLEVLSRRRSTDIMLSGDTSVVEF